MEQTTDRLKKDYTRRQAEAEEALGKVQRAIYRTGTLRLLLFVAGTVCLFYGWHIGWAVRCGIVLATVLPFGWLMIRHNRLFYRKACLEQEAAVNRQELAALEYDFSAFDNGKEFADPAHLYTFDLDVFGEHSLFQSLNRTCTQPGKRQLAAWLGKHLERRQEIEKRQEAVRELAAATEFRQRFRVLGLMHKGEAADEAELEAWAKSPALFRNRAGLRMLPATAAGANLVAIGLALVGILPASIAGMLWMGCLIAAMGFTHRISKLQVVYGKKLRILGTYAGLLRLMEKQTAQSALLQEVKEKAEGGEGRASHAIARLDWLMHALDQRNNPFMYALLNGLFFWELRQMMRIEAWKEEHAEALPAWLSAIGEMDALLSLATFAYNHPDYVYPEILPEGQAPAQGQAVGEGTSAPPRLPYSIRAEGLGHPLMRRERCVRNDINMETSPFFLIITGANMAGKSTYLRTVGVNYLLACTGAPVCARRMAVYPARLVTSLRTSDSLNDNESYFFAELKRLKLIIDKLQAGEELFIILDEILKGTNSMDKQKGSFALIKQFMALQANGIIATHDLLLGELAGLFPGHIRNYRFEADITGEELTFSYRLQPGVAQNMNACFLMQKMGIAMA